jgi:hypothetical protein
MLALLFVLNLVVSIFNAWSCGRAWTETRILGGWPRFMAWMGATMSAVGFTWCYAVVACFVGVSSGKLTPEQAQLVFELVYLAILFPLIGSGLAITVQSWVRFARERNWRNAGFAIYNTFADGYNLYNAVQHAPGMWDHVSKSLFSKDSKDEKGSTALVLIGVLVLCAGVLTTALIIRMVASARETELRLAAYERGART